ncbi:hypothetical protein MVA47_25890 [Williamsia sp. DF01-3]|nr:hypothetical protein [Williamsia sp. DF01-3]
MTDEKCRVWRTCQGPGLADGSMMRASRRAANREKPYCAATLAAGLVIAASGHQDSVERNAGQTLS